MNFTLEIPNQISRELPENSLFIIYKRFQEIFPISKLSYSPFTKKFYLTGEKYSHSKFYLQNEISNSLFGKGIEKYKINFKDEFSKGVLTKKNQTIDLTNILCPNLLIHLLKREKEGKFRIDYKNNCLYYFDLDPEKKRKTLKEINFFVNENRFHKTLESVITLDKSDYKRIF